MPLGAPSISISAVPARTCWHAWSAQASGNRRRRPRGRGRPKLGVVAREVTLLPRHWEWLAAQPGAPRWRCASWSRRRRSQSGRARQAQERAYHFMNAMAGDLPGFEEATRALFAGDREGFAERIAGWPTDVREHAAWLASDGES